jgi:alpha,alpha-trehalase
MIVPGGRFIEFYYWDTYWIVKGLLMSGMRTTAQMIVENLLGLVREHGFVPNGSRRYYLSRSQPPYLALMVELLVDAQVVNSSFVQHALPILDAEYKFWMIDGERALDVTARVRQIMPNLGGNDTFALNRYFSSASVPRAESAREDLQTASRVPPELRPQLYQQLRAGAESGWDYSSRWFRDGASLSTIDVSNLLPVDLNGLLFKVENVLAKLHEITNTVPPLNYTRVAERRAIAIRALLWNSKTAQWFDYNITSGTQTTHVSPANFLPLWFGCLDPVMYQNITVEDVAFSLKASGLIGPGGTCGSLTETGQQWDFPNVWPPLQHMLVEGLMTAGPRSEARKLGEQMATTLLQTAYVAFNTTGGFLLEKYNCTKLGAIGGGGEYELQAGFGWTNGVILSLLDLFPSTAAPDTSVLERGSYFS